MEEDILVHHGVKGQKWGVRKKPVRSSRPRQITSTPTSGSKIQQRIKARLASNKRSRARKRKQKTSAKLKTLQNANKANSVEEQLSIEERKAAVLKKRSGKALYKNADLFTTDELASAYRRLKLENDLNNIDPKVKTKGAKFVDSLNNAKKTMDAISGAYESYKKIDSMLGEMSGSSKKDEKKK